MMKKAWYDKYQNLNGTRQRDASQDTREFMSKMIRGVNCRQDYSLRIGGCSKCDRKNDHLEFLCPVYDKWNKNNCRVCSNGNHYERDCVERNALPAPTLNVTTVDSQDQLADKIRDMILSLKN